MTHTQALTDENYPDPHHDVYSKTIFGFWVYLLTDLIFFGVLFATYAVLVKKTFGGPTPSDLFYLPSALIQTLLLLTCSFTVGIANAFVHRKNKAGTLIFFVITFLLGIAFMVMEFNEFSRIMAEGYSWETSAFLSAYFTLVGIHGVHMLFALLWVIVLVIPVCYHGMASVSIKRLTCLKMFWQFVNIIWILIFSFVYLIGVH